VVFAVYIVEGAKGPKVNRHIPARQIRAIFQLFI